MDFLMFFKGFWANLSVDADFGAACAEVAGIGSAIFLPQVESHSLENLEAMANACHSNGMEFHAWTINNMVSKAYSPEFLEEHRDWLAVNRNGQTGLEFPLWGRQIWWCPSSEGYLDYYLRRWESLVDVGADGLHLDFIRYPDIWDYKDGLAIERREIPEYSFCYCPRCRRRFKAEVGVDPMDVSLNPENELYLKWRQWRMDVITQTVKTIREETDIRLKLSAAVFPTPDIARTVVLQDWVSFADQLDFICTMIYTPKQWGRPVSWIKDATEEGLAEMKGLPADLSSVASAKEEASAKADKCAYYAGFGYPIRQQSPDDLRTGVISAAEGGADGVVIFSYPGPTPEQMEAIRQASLSLEG